MKIFRPHRTVKGDFVIIDSQFPQKLPFAFRNSEINEYLARIKNVDAYAMYPMGADEKAGFAHQYGVNPQEFSENLKGYLRSFSKNEGRVHYLRRDKRYRFKLAYSFFLGETFSLLPFYEKNKIPFVFVLYPGGLFGLNSEPSDYMLNKIFASKYFRGVIVTQQITLDYLLSKKLCRDANIKYIYGGVVQLRKNDVKQRRRYLTDKKTFDICFVAAKYSEKGVDKGYDLFIETAKLLCESTNDIMFHVVGGFDESDIDVKKIRGRVKFYGYRHLDFLPKFYAGMDIILSPNRPFQLYDGNFDGFPIGNEAQYCGAAMFATDELNMNQFYVDGKDIVLLPLDAKKIADKITFYYSNLEEFYKLANEGQRKTQRLLDTDYQLNERMKFFEKFIKLEHKQKRIEASL